MDLEKVKKGLECCEASTNDNPFQRCSECPYNDISISVQDCRAVLSADALDLLKEQEPKPVKIVKNAYNHEFYYCPKCDRSFYETWLKKPKFCSECGQGVKWND